MLCKHKLKKAIINIFLTHFNAQRYWRNLKNIYFTKMKDLKNELNLKELSMGMSSDYIEAIKNESTFIRVGSKIFGERS